MRPPRYGIWYVYGVTSSARVLYIAHLRQQRYEEYHHPQYNSKLMSNKHRDICGTGLEKSCTHAVSTSGKPLHCSKHTIPRNLLWRTSSSARIGSKRCGHTVHELCLKSDTAKVPLSRCTFDIRVGFPGFSLRACLPPLDVESARHGQTFLCPQSRFVPGAWSFTWHKHDC